MEFQPGSAIIKLLKYQDGSFQVISGRKGISPKLPLKLAKRELSKLGVSYGEIDFAISDMEQQGTNVADFGVLRKSFICSTFDRLPEPLYGNS